MKTSELIKRIETLGNGLSVELLNKNVVLFADNKQTKICEVHDNIVTTNKETFAINSPISNSIELMFEYAKTPLEEREEVKKYRLKLPLQTWLGDYLYVGFNEAIYSYYIALISGDKSDRFTQKEIDAMPFDTNFFVKEEVN